MSTKETILSDFMELSPADQRSLLAHARAIAGEPKQEASETAADVSEALAAVWPAIVKKAKSQAIPLPPIPVVAHNRRLSKGCQALLDYTEFFGDLTKTERSAAIDVCVDCIFLWFRDRLKGRVPIGVKTLSQQLAHISEAVELQFPGYRGAGLLSATIRGIKAK